MPDPPVILASQGRESTKVLIAPAAEPGKPPEIVEVPGVSWFKSPSTLTALGGIAAGVIVFCHALHIPIPFTQTELVAAMAALGTTGACLYFLYKRWKAGLDPANPARMLTK